MGFSSLEDDVRQGEQAYPEMIKAFGGAYDHPRIQSLVTRVGQRLASQSELQQLPYEFTVLNSPIVNAAALPGGKIGITRGLIALADSEAELAGVLAHEIGHVTGRHGVQAQGRSILATLGLAALGIATGSAEVMQLGQSLAATFIQRYSRQQEFEADTLGVRYLTRAGYDPNAMASFLASMREHAQLEARMSGLPPGKVDEFNIMASHPRTIERVRQAEEAAQTATVANPLVGRRSYLQDVNGMLFGDDPAQGFVRGQKFIHPDVRIEFEVPSGYLLRNSTDKVIASNPDGAGIVFDMGQVERSSSLGAYMQNEWLAQVELRQIENITVNGISAVTGAVRANTSDGPVDLRAVVYRGDGNAVFRLLFFTPARLSSALTNGLKMTTYSFRRLGEDEARSIHPLRLIVVDAHAEDSVDSLSRTLPFGNFNSDWFRLLNDFDSGETIQPGQSLKVIAS